MTLVAKTAEVGGEYEHGQSANDFQLVLGLSILHISLFDMIIVFSLNFRSKAKL